ncbi:MAG: copper amine oxidase N-terminal domain-containing protein [Firmicutes bacterium]|nr:copper amine oxidase N-terminal domain-containing protein [Bacillota bacterium]
MKKILSAFLAAAVIFTALPVLAEDAAVLEDVITVIAGDKAIEFDVNPIIENDILLVSVRELCEACGATAEWDAETQTVSIEKPYSTVISMKNLLITVGSSQMQRSITYVEDGSVSYDVIELGAPARIIDGCVFVPLRRVVYELGYNHVVWDAETHAAWLSTLRVDVSSVGAAAGADEDVITVMAKSKAIKFDVNPIIENDRILVPVRALCESSGAAVEWDAETQTVSIEKSNAVETKRLIITTDSSQMQKSMTQINDGSASYDVIELDAPAKIIDGRTFVPLRAVAEELGYNVITWDGVTRTAELAIVTSDPPASATAAPLNAEPDV